MAENIQEFLNQVENPNFQIKEKRGVRDRWNILQTKFKKRMREEEAASWPAAMDAKCLKKIPSSRS